MPQLYSYTSIKENAERTRRLDASVQRLETRQMRAEATQCLRERRPAAGTNFGTAPGDVIRQNLGVGCLSFSNSPLSSRTLRMGASVQRPETRQMRAEATQGLCERRPAAGTNFGTAPGDIKIVQ
ncbi:hypothetical protein J6590_064686 [Homalodisca vitripennis]|nr:hypothetical protein J6590_064686 [Homalodisca vitripennis]